MFCLAQPDSYGSMSKSCTVPTIGSNVQPIHLQFVKAMIQHPNNSARLIFCCQYQKEYKTNTKYTAAPEPPLVPLKDCNVTYVPISTVTTSPSKLAKALNVQLNKSFC